MPRNIDISDIPLIDGLPKPMKPISRTTRPDEIEHHLALRIAEHPEYAKIKEPMVRGFSLAKTVEYVQERLGLFNDVNPSHLEGALREVRNSIPKEELVREALPSLHKKAVETVTEGLDVLEELKRLYTLQMKRVEIDFQIEQNVRKLLPGTHREVKGAREILATYAEVQMDFGLVKRNLGTAEVAVHQQPAPVAEIISNPKSRQRVLGMAQKMLALGVKREQAAEEDSSIVQDESAA